MGGGDLNLKKSWHPSTLKNIERVWKAEQKHEAEQKKIEQLQRELAEERARQEMRQFAEDQGVVKRKQERLDWMYQGPSSMVNREDYLLGRPIDKTFEVMQKSENGVSINSTEETEGSMPSSLFSGNIETVAVDLATKIREDPLFLIRKQEEENKKRLLNNPVRMKQLQQLLKQQIDKKEKKKKKKSKDKKKNKDDSGSASSSDKEYSRKKEKKRNAESSIKKTKRDSPENFREIYENSHKSKKDEKSKYDDDYKKYKMDYRISGDISNKREAKTNGHSDRRFKDHSSRHQRKVRCCSSSDDDTLNSEKNKYRNNKTKTEYYSRRDRRNEYIGMSNKVTNHPSSSEEELDRGNFQKHLKGSALIRESDSHKKIKRKHSVSDNESSSVESVELKQQNHYERDYSTEDTRYKLSQKHGRHDSSSDDDKPKKKAYGLIISERALKQSSSKPKLGRYSRSRSRSQSRSPQYGKKNRNSARDQTRASSITNQSTHRSRKMTAEEMERKRQEMMSDAKWRDEQRAKNVQRYQEDDELEIKHTHKGSSDDFIRPMLSKAAAAGSVESRIKSNRYNIQRSKSSMEGSFAKR